MRSFESLEQARDVALLIDDPQATLDLVASVVEYVGVLEARVARLEAKLEAADRRAKGF